MTGIEIFLIVVGMVAIIGSFVFSNQFESTDQKNVNVLDSIDEEALHKRIDEVVDEILDGKLENTEAKIDKIMNEKIMTVGEYSDNVISNIDKNHDEVMFLYGMLNDKEKDVKKAILDVENLKRSIKKDKAQTTEAEAVNTDVEEYIEEKNAEAKLERELLTGHSDASFFDASNHNSSNNPSDKAAKNPKGRNARNRKGNRQSSYGRNEEDKNSGVALSAKNVKEKSNNNEKILELYRQGKEPVEIAKKLKLGMGEVRLVIDLYKNR